MSKRLIKEIKPCCYLYIDDHTGIAWIEDGIGDKTINNYCIHPSMKTREDGVKMKEQRYWKKDDKLIVGNNLECFNISKINITSELDKIVAEHCKCEECIKRR